MSPAVIADRMIHEDPDLVIKEEHAPLSHRK